MKKQKWIDDIRKSGKECGFFWDSDGTLYAYFRGNIIDFGIER